jgi:hypothetical protein
MTAVGWVLRQLEVVSTLDALLPWDPAQCRLSPGTRLLALMLCALFDHTALFRVRHVLGHQDLPVLFGPGVTADAFNDDALGRALDKLAAARPAAVFHSVAAKVWAHEHVPFETLHGDTTAVALYGTYEAPAPEVLQIVHGYSKDHRPDLQQVGMGLVSSPDGIPLLGDVHDGNLNDTTWNAGVIAQLQDLLPEETLRSILYTADCKVVTPDNLLAMERAGLHWLSRLPETYDAAQTLKLRAWAEAAWDAPAPISPRSRAAQYRLCAFSDVVLSADPDHALAGLRYRCVVVHSSALEARARARQQRLLAAERAAIAAAEAGRPTFPSHQAARAAGAQVLSRLDLRYHAAKPRTESLLVPGKRPRGRPRKDAPPPPTVRRYTWRAEVTPPDAPRLRREIELRSTFLLVTNDARRTPRELLGIYKRQQTAVEIPFHRTKALPVAPMFLERPERIRAMGYVLLMAYVAFAVLQRRVRSALAERGEHLQTYDNRRTATPSGQTVLDHLGDIHTDVLDENGEDVRVIKLTAGARRVLDLLGIPLAAFASEPGPPSHP